MRTEAKILLFFSTFGIIISICYWFTSYDDGGGIMLVGFGLLGMLPGSYYYWWSRRMRPRPEDRPEATQAEGAGVIGAFPSSSIWPFVLGLGAAMVGMSLVFGFWTAIFGFTLAISAVLGVIAESRRGGAV